MPRSRPAPGRRSTAITEAIQVEGLVKTFGQVRALDGLDLSVRTGEVVGTAAGLAYGARAGDLGQTGRVLGGALAQIPATWVPTGIVLAVYGLAPRLSVAGWVAFAGFVLLG